MSHGGGNETRLPGAGQANGPCPAWCRRHRPELTQRWAARPHRLLRYSERTTNMTVRSGRSACRISPNFLEQLFRSHCPSTLDIAASPHRRPYIGERRRLRPFYRHPLTLGGSKENRNGIRGLGSRDRRGRNHPGHSRRDGSPGRPAAHELHGLGDLPDRADRLGVRGRHRRDRGENVPVRLAASQGNHPQPVRRPVRPGGGDRHPDRRLRHGLAVGQDRPPPDRWSCPRCWPRCSSGRSPT